MRRRDKKSGKAAKPQRPKAFKRRDAQTTARHRNSAASAKETDVAQLAYERDEALEQLAATSEVLKIISSSPGELEPVFSKMLENAARICEAKFGTLALREGGGKFRVVAMHGAPPEWAEKRTREPVFIPGPLNKLSIVARTKKSTTRA